MRQDIVKMCVRKGARSRLRKGGGCPNSGAVSSYKRGSVKVRGFRDLPSVPSEVMALEGTDIHICMHIRPVACRQIRGRLLDDEELEPPRATPLQGIKALGFLAGAFVARDQVGAWTC